MSGVIVRWTIGQTKAREFSPQALDLLDMSVKFGIFVMDGEELDVEYFICHNNLAPETLDKVKGIAGSNGVALVDVNDMLPKELRNNNVKNSWWKFSPPRLDTKKYEIIIDNDVVVWRMPKTLKDAIAKGSLVALTDGVGGYYGKFRQCIQAIDPNLCLNAGLLGLPPDIKMDPREVLKDLPNELFYSEQGFTAFKFAQYPGMKVLIPRSEVEQLNVNAVAPQDLINSYDGGHFCGCSYGHFYFWQNSYAKIVREHYNKVREGMA